MRQRLKWGHTTHGYLSERSAFYYINSTKRQTDHSYRQHELSFHVLSFISITIYILCSFTAIVVQSHSWPICGYVWFHCYVFMLNLFPHIIFPSLALPHCRFGRDISTSETLFTAISLWSCSGLWYFHWSLSNPYYIPVGTFSLMNITLPSLPLPPLHRSLLSRFRIMYMRWIFLHVGAVCTPFRYISQISIISYFVFSFIPGFIILHHGLYLTDLWDIRAGGLDGADSARPMASSNSFLLSDDAISMLIFCFVDYSYRLSQYAASIRIPDTAYTNQLFL